MSSSEAAAAPEGEGEQLPEQSQREKELEALFGTRVILGPLQLKQPLLHRELDDGLTEAQRLAEQAKEKRLAETAAKQTSYGERLQQFNKKLSKLTDHNEMPRISG